MVYVTCFEEKTFTSSKKRWPEVRPVGYKERLHLFCYSNSLVCLVIPVLSGCNLVVLLSTATWGFSPLDSVPQSGQYQTDCSLKDLHISQKWCNVFQPDLCILCLKPWHLNHVSTFRPWIQITLHWWFNWKVRTRFTGGVASLMISWLLITVI